LTFCHLITIRNTQSDNGMVIEKLLGTILSSLRNTL
jgi:hypothetical protein